MRSVTQFPLVMSAAVVLSASAWAQAPGTDFSKIDITTERIAPNLYMLSGSAGLDPNHQDAAGGRIGVLAGPDGIFMVDAQYAQLTDKVLAAMNANFAGMGVTIFGREELREELAHPPGSANGNPAPARDPASLPVVTYGLGGPVNFYMNGEIVDLIPVRAAHTGGDTMVRFENANAIMIGDFYRNYGYPFIDTNKLDFALATTYSLDLTTLLASTLHLSVLGDDRPLSDFQNGIMLLESLRRSTDRLAVFCQGGQTYPPKFPHVLYSLLEPVVIPVKAPLGGAFHPKLWALRFERQDEKPVLRVVVLSRNLTNDRSWDITLAVEGAPTGRQWRSNEGLGTLIASLPDMNPLTPPATKAKVLELAGQLHSAEWQLPDGFDELRFSSLGFNGKGWSPQPSQRLAVISPFISASALAQLANSTSEPVLLVSRHEELDALNEPARNSFSQCLTLREAAETEDGEDLSEESEVLQGLHAKVYISQDGSNTTIAIGSANATSPALDGRNVELIAELTGRKKNIGGIDEIFSQENLGKVLESYTPRRAPALDDAVLLAEQRLKEAKAALAAAGLRLSCSGDGDLRKLVLKPGGPVALEGIETLKAWPVSLKSDLAMDTMQIRLGQDAALPDCSLAAVTGFVAFEMTSPPAPDPCRFVLNLPVDGLPEERLAAVVRTIVANREGFLKYLLFLLADMDEDGLPNDVLLALTAEGNRNGYSLESALPLLAL